MWQSLQAASGRGRGAGRPRRMPVDSTPDMSTETAAITLQQVSKMFGTFEAVREANFPIADGEFFTMLGPSGCGKTTTLRMIAGFEQPTSGRIHLRGVDVTDVAANRRNVNMVFQHYALFPHM